MPAHRPTARGVRGGAHDPHPCVVECHFLLYNLSMKLFYAATLVIVLGAPACAKRTLPDAQATPAEKKELALWMTDVAMNMHDATPFADDPKANARLAGTFRCEGVQVTVTAQKKKPWPVLLNDGVKDLKYLGLAEGGRLDIFHKKVMVMQLRQNEGTFILRTLQEGGDGRTSASVKTCTKL